MKPADEARRTMLMVEIPRDELAIRIAIQCTGTRPKAGMSLHHKALRCGENRLHTLRAAALAVDAQQRLSPTRAQQQPRLRRILLRLRTPGSPGRT